MINALAIKKKFFMQFADNIQTPAVVNIQINISSNQSFDVVILEYLKITFISGLPKTTKPITIPFAGAKTQYGDDFGGDFYCELTREETNYWEYSNNYLDQQNDIHFVDPYWDGAPGTNEVGIISWENDETIEESFIDDIKNKILNVLKTSFKFSDISVSAFAVNKGNDTYYIRNYFNRDYDEFAFNLTDNVRITFSGDYSGTYSDSMTGNTEYIEISKNKYKTIPAGTKTVSWPDFEDQIEEFGPDLGVNTNYVFLSLDGVRIPDQTYLGENFPVLYDIIDYE